MIRLFAAALIASTSLTVAQAAEYEFDSTVSKATVFPRTAKVVRVATGELQAGNHVIVIDDLPGNVFPGSVRVKGVSDGDLVQSSVDVRQVSLKDNKRPELRRKLEAEIETLNRESVSLKRVLSDVDLQRKLLQTLAGNALAGGRGDQGVSVSAEALTGVLESSANRLAMLQKQEADVHLRLADVAKELDYLRIKLNEMAPVDRAQTLVSINVTAKEAQNASFEVEYQVAGAGWQPLYDARLETGDDIASSSVELVRRASVFQHTGESWDGIELNLSTARPSLATSAPELNPLEIDLAKEKLHARQRSKLGMFNDETGDTQLQSTVLAEQKIAVNAPMAEPEVVAEAAGFQAVFKIPGRNTVENTGEVKTVTIDRYAFSADVHALAVPRLDLSAYLVAGFRYDGETPLLPGKVALSRDGIFIGNGHLPMVAPGEDHEMGFGMDDQIVVTRVETGKEKGESGFISSVNTDRREWKMTVTNHHDFTIPVKVRDRMPVSNQEEIEVSLTRKTTPIDAKNADDKRGIVEWHNDLNGGAVWEIDFGYEVSWPEELKISRLD